VGPVRALSGLLPHGVPAGWLAGKLGYKGGIIAGLLLVALGGFWFVPASHISAFWAYLLGVCLIAAGLTFLETVANPYTTVLGPEDSAATRINLAQSCNGIGWLLGPQAGALFFYNTDAHGASTGSETLWIPYLSVAVIVVVLAGVFWRTPLPDVQTPDDYGIATDGPSSEVNAVEAFPRRGLALGLLWTNLLVLSISVGMIITAISTIWDSNEADILKTFLVGSGVVLVVLTATMVVCSHLLTHHSIWAHPHFSMATIAQFFYVAAQAGVFAYFINYMTSQVPMAVSDKAASSLTSAALFCFLVGRVTGSGLLKIFPPQRVLGLYALMNIVLCGVVMLKLGWVSVVGVFLIYFFMSVMFPTIFALGIHGLGNRSKRASAYIVMAIMGGAIMPKLMGAISDRYGVSIGFVVPLICFTVVAVYGFAWTGLSASGRTVSVSVGGH